jgi:hypothetical protein
MGFLKNLLITAVVIIIYSTALLHFASSYANTNKITVKNLPDTSKLGFNFNQTAIRPNDLLGGAQRAFEFQGAIMNSISAIVNMTGEGLAGLGVDARYAGLVLTLITTLIILTIIGMIFIYYP